jgi:uncharacterized membrane protein
VTLTPEKETKRIGFRWAYVAAPVGVLLIAIIIALVYYWKLPHEIAYRFSHGMAVNQVARGTVLAWALGLQLVFTLFALAITAFITMGARRMLLAETPMLRVLLAIIGNILGLPQIIIAYAMMDIFIYNIHGKALPSLLAFTIIVMLAGGIVLAVYFSRAVTQSKKLKKENSSGSESNVRK